jgi:predicted nucleic acid-binding protein
MRVFLDANVLFSAAYRDTGSVRVFFEIAARGVCSLVASPYAIEEARRNIAMRYPDRAAALEALAARIEACREPSPETVAKALGAGLPAKDAPILAAAVEAGCHILVTGDRTHFGKLYGRRWNGTAVMLPADAVELLIG